MMSKIKIIGCGSRLMGDDAIGCVVARELSQLSLPRNVVVEEAGTPGLNLLSLMHPGDRVIIIDAVVTGEKAPGTLTVYQGDDLPKPSQMPISAHHIAIPETIALGWELQPELMPDSIEIWGIEVKTPILKKMEMSDEIARVVPHVLEKIREEFLQGVESLEESLSEQ